MHEEIFSEKGINPHNPAMKRGIISHIMTN
jgi:hypothetical protein